MDLSKNVTESEESEFTFSNYSKKIDQIGNRFWISWHPEVLTSPIDNDGFSNVKEKLNLSSKYLLDMVTHWEHYVL